MRNNNYFIAKLGIIKENKEIKHQRYVCIVKIQRNNTLMGIDLFTKKIYPYLDNISYNEEFIYEDIPLNVFMKSTDKNLIQELLNELNKDKENVIDEIIILINSLDIPIFNKVILIDTILNGCFYYVNRQMEILNTMKEIIETNKPIIEFSRLASILETLEKELDDRLNEVISRIKETQKIKKY